MNSQESTKETGKSVNSAAESKEQRLARQLRENLAKRKAQSRQRNTKPRKFKKMSD